MAKFNDILKKAEKRTRTSYPDYTLELPDATYQIPYPDALQFLEFSELEDDQMLKQLQVIFRKSPSAWNDLVRNLDGKDAAVIQALIEDMFDFWNSSDKGTPGK